MYESKFKLTNKVDPSITVTAAYTASNTQAGDGTALQTFTDLDGVDYVFFNPNIHDTSLDSITRLENNDWTIEQLPFETN